MSVCLLLCMSVRRCLFPMPGCLPITSVMSGNCQTVVVTAITSRTKPKKLIGI